MVQTFVRVLLDSLVSRTNEIRRDEVLQTMFAMGQINTARFDEVRLMQVSD
jgi:hypothetical protein